MGFPLSSFSLSYHSLIFNLAAHYFLKMSQRFSTTIISLIGAPGSGKGTYGSLLASRLKCTFLSVGDGEYKVLAITSYEVFSMSTHAFHVTPAKFYVSCKYFESIQNKTPA